MDHTNGSGNGRISQASKGAALRATQPLAHVKSGPTLLKRKSDGAMVRLKCVDCGRSDFGSPQGFINHCRIQHQRSYSSHDAAAEEAGERVELDQAVEVVGEEPASASATQLIHHLVRSARTIQPMPKIKSELRGQSSSSLTPASKPLSSLPLSSSSDFMPSSTTPHLSDFVRFRGLGLDLDNIVTDAKSRISLPEMEVESENDETEASTPVHFPIQGRRPPTTGSKQPSRSQKSSSLSPNAPQNAIPSPTSGRSCLGDGRMPDTAEYPRGFAGMSQPHSPGLRGGAEPSPTESHQAPSLVDDDGDAEEVHSPPTSLISPDESMSVDFHIQDEDIHQDEAHRFGIPGLQRDYQKQPADVMGGFGPGPSAQHRSSLPSGFRNSFQPREEKHVTFISPSPGLDPASSPVRQHGITGEPPKRGRKKRRRTAKG